METLYTLENERLRVKISDRGAEIRSLCVLATGEELMWRRDPAIWRSSAPWLFPIIGQLKNGSFIWQGRTYSTPMHGFASKCTFALHTLDKDSVVLRLTETPETLLMFPWRFCLDIAYTLQDDGLAISCTVSTPEPEMYFSIGAHPGFACQAGDVLRFNGEKPLRCRRLQPGVHLLAPDAVTLPAGRLTLAESLFEDDAMLLEKPDVTQITLEKRSGADVRFTFDPVSWLGIWANVKNGLQYICLEPWHGVDDPVDATGLIAQKKDILRVSRDESFTLRLRIQPVI